MANDRLIFEVVAQGKNLKVVQKQAGDLADSTERANKARERGTKVGGAYHKQEKGIAQTGLSSAKGFSKMAQSIGSGSSGLVGAYATLAANVFAATAAFGALRSAAQVEQLAQGLEYVGLEGGRNLQAIAANLREITGLAISSEEAMRGVALGASAGFSNAQLEDLTKVARGASLALGRDMGDAMSRLVRGAAKLEPEILDELGIMVRLDDATRDYADAIGVNVASLSQYERRMAFVNAINEQGLRNFGSLSNAVDPNAYDMLSASLQDLYKDFTNLLNVGLAPIAKFIAGSLPAMIGVVVLFASSISKMMAPALFSAAKGAADAATNVKTMAASKLADLKVTKEFPKGYNKFRDSVVAGTASMEEMDEKQKKLTNSLRTHQRHVDLYEEAQRKGVKYEGSERIGIKDEATLKRKKAIVEDLKKHQEALNETVDGGTRAQIKNTEAMAYSNARLGSLREGWGQVTEAQKLQTAQTLKGIEGQGKVRSTLKKTGAAVGRLSMRLKFLGTAFLNLIPFIGIAVTAIGLLIAAWEKFGPKPSALEKAMDKTSESIKHINKTFIQLETTLMLIEEQVDRTIAKWKAYSGAVKTATDAIIAMAKAQLDEAQAGKQEEAAEISRLRALKKRLEAARAAGETFNLKGFEGFGWFESAYGSLDELQMQLDKVNRKIGESETAFEKFKKAGDIIDEKSRELIAMKIEEQAQALSQAGASSVVEVKKMGEVAQRVRDGTLYSMKALTQEMVGVAASSQAVQEGFTGISDKVKKFTSEVNKLGQKQVTPFDNVLIGLEAIVDQFDLIEKRGQEVFEAMGGTATTLPGQAASVARWRAEKELREAILSRFKFEAGAYKRTEADIKRYHRNVKDAVDVVKINKEEVKQLSDIHKKVSEVVKSMPGFLEEQLDLEEAIRLKKLDGLEAQKTAQALILSATMSETEIYERLAPLREQITTLQAQELDGEVRRVKILVSQEQQEKKIFEIAKAVSEQRSRGLQVEHDILSTRMKIAALDRPSGQRELSAGENYALAVSAANAEHEQKLIQHALKMTTLQLDMEILKLQNDLLHAQINERIEQKRAAENNRKGGARKSVLEEIEAEQTRVNSLFETLGTHIENKKTAIEKIMGQELILSGEIKQLNVKQAKNDFKQSLIDSVNDAANATEAAEFLRRAVRPASKETIAKMEQHSARVATLVTDILAAGTDPEKLNEALEKAREAAANPPEGSTAPIDIDLSKMEKFKLLSGFLDPMIENLKSIGPDGPLMGAAMQGMMNITDAGIQTAEVFARTGDDVAKGYEKVAAVAQVVGSVVAAAANIMAEASKRRVASIDKEIEAEKKRDGKSKQSLAKIKAMEAKKESIKKKAFEQNKKMQIAQAIISTLTGAIGAYASLSAIPGIGPFIAPAAAAAITAVGLATVAMIAATKYEGGAASGASAPPMSSISMGSRNNKVDIAGGRGNAAGELAYLRGARGSGSGAHDFRPAFTGRKYRAAGGAAYVVGEQGPELFVPSVPGQVVANDDMAAGTAGTVNFTINAIDATGVEEVLVGQRGNIIGMIRESANEYGTNFLEEVDTEAYTDTTEGTVYGRA